MQTERRVAANPQTKPTDLGCEFVGKCLLPSTYTIAVCYSYSARLHRVSKNVPLLACYNFDAHEWILIFFGRNVTDKVGNQKTLYCATSNNLCFCTTCPNVET